MSSPSPKPQLKGCLTVKVIRCSNLDRQRVVGKMDPYVKISCGGSEKFETKVATDMERDPVWNQSFVFNLEGKESDLHIRVFDKGVMSSDYLGRFDMSLFTLLEKGGGAHTFDLHDPENFRKNTGTIELSVAFEGTGGPAANAEKAPISGPFHLLHNSSGFLAHPTGTAAGSGVALRAGGVDQQRVAFEFQGAYVRVCAVPGFYLHATADGPLTIQPGISDDARWKWTGIGLQHVSSSQLVRPKGDVAASNTPLVLQSGAGHAAGFLLVPCKGPPVGADTPSTPSSAADSQPGAAAHAAAAASSPAAHAHASTAASAPAADLSKLSIHSHSTAEGFDPTKPDTCPATLRVKAHPHELSKRPTIYKGEYVCDACKKAGHGLVYHCAPCQFDIHPACAKLQLTH